LQAYERLRPRQHDTLVTVTATKHVAVNETSSLILGDGTVVHAPEDLLPVVPEDSPTARAARAAVAARDRAHNWTFVGALLPSWVGEGWCGAPRSTTRRRWVWDWSAYSSAAG
jgi:hypothetical protein